MIYMQIVLDFSDFDKAQEDTAFFELLFMATCGVIRMAYGVRAQKQAEVELHRVFYNVFNHGARKHQNDPQVRLKTKLTPRICRPYDIAKERSPMMSQLLPTAQEIFKREGYGQAKSWRRPRRENSIEDPKESPCVGGGDDSDEDAHQASVFVKDALTREKRQATRRRASIYNLGAAAAAASSEYMRQIKKQSPKILSHANPLQAVRTPQQKMADGSHPSLMITL